jgi:hypothetical protein
MTRQDKIFFAMVFSAGWSVAFLFPPVRAFASGITQSAYNIIENAGSALTQRTTLNFTGSGVSCSDSAPVTVCNIPGGGTTNQSIRSIGGGFDGGGSALSSGGVTYFTVPFACTIQAWNITVDTGTITFDVWKVASGTAIPTVSNSITASALPAISTGTAIHSTTLTGWTTSVSANDIFGIDINAVSSATKASLVLQCNAS